MSEGLFYFARSLPKNEGQFSFRKVRSDVAKISRKLVQGCNRDRLGRFFLTRPYWLMALIGLPITIWLDLRNLSDETLTRQARSLNGIITSVRSYYAKNVVSRVVSSDTRTQEMHNYLDVRRAIPIPGAVHRQFLEPGDHTGDTGHTDCRSGQIERADPRSDPGGNRRCIE